MSGHERAEIDARLEEAFRRLPGTDDLRDLRDEVRAGLVARVSELEATGAGPTEAVHTAFAELGDIEELAAEVTGASGPAAGGRATTAGVPSTGYAPTSADARTTGSAQIASPGQHAAELAARHHVRPKPGFVVRTVVLAIVAAVVLVLIVLTALDIVALPLPFAAVLAVVLLAAPLGAITADSLLQETTTHFPMPVGRAVAFGAAVFLGVAGIALAVLMVADTSQVWLIAIGVPLLVVAIAWLSYLGATQTNRTKPWMRGLQADDRGTDRFSQDEAAAARFGIYTAVIWVIAIAAFVVLSITIGFTWSWLPLVAGVAVFFLVLARMLFPSGSEHGTASGRPKGTNHD